MKLKLIRIIITIFILFLFQQTSFPADLKDVVINEIAWMGTDASINDEWIELYNNTNSSIDLTKWKLQAVDGSPVIELSGIIPSQEYFLLERSDDNTILDIPADLIYSGSLGNSGEHLQLIDSLNQIIDEIDNSAGWFAGDNTLKISMERIHPMKDGSDSTSWDSNNGIIKSGVDANNNAIYGTPKSQNSVFDTTTAVEVTFHEPRNFNILSNYPNPFNPETTIQFNISGNYKNPHVQIILFNAIGRKVRILVKKYIKHGKHQITWDGCDENGKEMSSGIYFYRLEINGIHIQTQKMVKVK
jgi:hypothetical protein